ncbi:ABC transporter ATP-binding protein [Leucobacter sp. CSA2]|uniref:ABC transporter ATP-binding protein n=1 Tax=Leucobacter edaphi TaxID=2796472 RepID=A0A934QES5_9MICO|nr:ABC transporter ATP-binding protein [Leucobacter edaphi]MBK0422620.1 ABC transporter ATP-binding protein [Leucobacter edaphi]
MNTTQQRLSPAGPVGGTTGSPAAGERPQLVAYGVSVEGRRGERIVSDVDVSVRAGECLAIVGPSGAGKSVLARTLLGLTQADPAWRVTGERFEIAGQDLRRARQSTWRRLRGRTVALVLQDALQSLDGLRTIGAEVGEALAVRGVRRKGRDAESIRALTAAGLAGAAERLAQRPGQLSGGMRQRALIASAIVGEPAVLIADEPTTALDPVTAGRVLDLLGSLRDAGTGIVLVSHDLAAVSRIADRVAVLDGGRIVEIGSTRQVLTAPRSRTARELVAAIPDGHPAPAPRLGPELLALREVSRIFAAPDGGETGVRGISLALRAGESLGIVGSSGAGKTTLARLLVGAERPDSGEIDRCPGPAGPPTIRLIPQDPLSTFDPRWRVERIIGASRRSPAAPSPAELLRSVGLDPSLLGRAPASLSGGQRQRVAIARALAAEPDILVCDEPVSALDAATQSEVIGLLGRLREERGVALVFVSHDLAAVRALCSRTVVLSDGRIVEDGATEELFSAPVHEVTAALVSAATAGPHATARRVPVSDPDRTPEGVAVRD